MDIKEDMGELRSVHTSRQYTQAEVRCLPVNIFSAIAQGQMSKLPVRVDKRFHRALPVTPSSEPLPDVRIHCLAERVLASDWAGRRCRVDVSFCVPGGLCPSPGKACRALPVSVDGALVWEEKVHQETSLLH